MLSSQIFYHEITRKTIVAFGTLFSDIKIRRESQDRSQLQTVAVPIAYAPKEKWVVKIEQDPTHDNYTYTTLPRMSFEVTGYEYDPSRRVGKMNYLTCSTVDHDGKSMKKVFAPVPYNIDISLYVLTKTQEDGLQIIEQIVPYFTPEFTMSIKGLTDMNTNLDIPIVLNNLSVQDDYDGDFQTRRFVTWTLNFTIKTYMFGPVTEHGVINRVLVDMTDIDAGYDYAKLDMIGNPNGDIMFSWEEE